MGTDPIHGGGAHQVSSGHHHRGEGRQPGTRSPLLDPGWSYVRHPNLDDISAEAWRFVGRQKLAYFSTERAYQALKMLEVQKDEPSFAYHINNYEHCLQAATMVMQARGDEETIVCTLFHDIGHVVCEESHGAFVANLLRPYVSERNVWILERHPWFQYVHCSGKEGIDVDARERWRGHPYFVAAAAWVARYDVTSLCSDGASYPLAAFDPMVQRIFSRAPSLMPMPA